MNPELLFENLIGVVLAVMAVAFVWKIVQHGGPKGGAVFGSRVDALVGEIDGHRQAMHSLKRRVHRLRGSTGQPEIGIELVAKSFASDQR